MNRNFTIPRNIVGPIASFIGGLGLLIAILVFIWQSTFDILVIVPLMVGFIGIVLWAVITPQEFRDFVTGRQAQRGTIAIFSTLLLIGIVSLVYIIIQRQVITIDMTSGSRFTLSEQSYEVLRALARTTEQIQITGFYTAEELVQRELDDQYFRLYETESNGQVRRVYVDPREQPAFASRYTSLLEQGYNLFISFVNEDGTLDLSTTQVIERSANQERDVTQAISRLLITGVFTVYFETGLGTPDPLSDTAGGMSIINNVIQANGLITQSFNLEEIAAAGGTIPANASALIIARPTRPTTPAEVQIIDAYLKNGGALFILADIFFTDDIFMDENDPFTEYLWNNYGLRPFKAVVVDPAVSAQSELDIMSAAVYDETEIGANLNNPDDPNTATVFRMARPIEVDTTPPVTNGSIIISSPQSWGETNLTDLIERNQYTLDDDADLRGPLTTVAWAFDQNTQAKVLIVGDGDFATNGQINTTRGNSILFFDGLGWLTGFTQQVSFGFRTYTTGIPTLFVSNQVLDNIAFFTVFVMPGSMLVLAAIMWLRRRAR